MTRPSFRISLKRLRREHGAATAIEYALLAALIGGAAMAGLIALGLSLDLLFSALSGHVTANTPPPPPPRCVQVGSQCPK